MKEIGMLFNAPMVRALLDGSKTQTRRVMKRQPHEEWLPAGYVELHGFDKHGELTPDKVIGWGAVNEDGDDGYCCPYGQPGDRIWVRETHRPIFGQTCGLIAVDYRADPREKWERLGDAPDCLVKGTKWTPSIHMRREYSRILLEIVSVRAESLQDISEADALTEGVRLDKAGGFFIDGADGRHASPVDSSAIEAFKSLWESTGGSWAANPWLWVIEFKRVTP